MEYPNKKVIIVSGASSGIGLEIANLFLKENYIVYGIGQRELNDVEFNYERVNICNFSECEKLVNMVIEKHGKIDVLVNNAGMGISGPIEFTEIEDAKKLFDVNFFGAVNLTKCVLPSMRENRSGRIINVSSVASFVPIPFQVYYSASKSALDTFASGLRSEVKEFNIKVVNVHPGDVKTNFTAVRKKARLEENNPYAKNCNSAISAMEKDEQNGMKPIKVAKVVLKLAKKKILRKTNVVGGKYKLMCFALNLFNPKLKEAIVRKFYF